MRTSFHPHNGLPGNGKAGENGAKDWGENGYVPGDGYRDVTSGGGGRWAHTDLQLAVIVLNRTLDILKSSSGGGYPRPFPGRLIGKMKLKI